MQKGSKDTAVTIAGRKIPEADSAEYFGMTIIVSGASVPQKRAVAGWTRLRELEIIGILQQGLSTHTEVQLYKTFMRPACEFGIYLS